MAKDTNKNNKRQAFVEAKAISFGVDYSANLFGYYYDSTNKIAFIAFDKFTVDYQKWDAYYKGDTAKLKELEAEDTYAFVRKSLYDAKAKGAESVVFDFTTNGGGDVAAVIGVFGLINGAEATETKNNIVDKTRMNSNYTIDINLDGKYDEQDVNEAKSFNFNIFGLTSSIAFSSGNYLPSLMKAKGFKMIGEKTGGGSCALSKEATADGYLYLRSTYYSLCDDLGNNIDEGITVDYNLASTKEDMSYDVSKYFDVKTIKEIITKLK